MKQFLNETIDMQCLYDKDEQQVIQDKEQIIILDAYSSREKQLEKPTGILSITYALFNIKEDRIDP